MTTRLPLRIDPLPGEWWRSYLVRVATVYGVHPLSLMGRLHGIQTVERRHVRWSGIAMSDAAATNVGAIINLDTSQIQAMHLSAYDGTALDFSALTHSTFDPIRASSTERLPLSTLGPLVKATTDRYCPACSRAKPQYRAMSWRLHVHLLCTIHRVLLANGGTTTVDDLVAVSDDVVARQRAVLDRLAPTVENAAFFAHLEAQLMASSGGAWPTLARHGRETPATALGNFSVAVDRVTSPGFPDYQGFAGWTGLSAAKYLRAPQPSAFDGSLRCFPHLFPMHVFAGGLSDLLHRVPIRHARAIASVGTLMAATGRELDGAVMILPPARHRRTTTLFLDCLIHLEREGRAEQFWSLCAQAATQLIREGVDYRHREQVCGDEDLYLAAVTAEPSAYVRTVRTWLVDQWACTYTSSNLRPSVRDGSIEHFDHQFGPGMRAALERIVKETAA